MFYVLVMLTGQPAPVVFGITNAGYAARLATMDGVEWVTPPIASNGVILDVDDLIRQGLVSKTVQPYRPASYAEQLQATFSRPNEPQS